MQKKFIYNVILLSIVGLASIPCSYMVNYTVKTLYILYAFVGNSLYAMICGVVMYFIKRIGGIADIVCVGFIIALIYYFMTNHIGADNYYALLLVQLLTFYICKIFSKR